MGKGRKIRSFISAVAILAAVLSTNAYAVEYIGNNRYQLSGKENEDTDINDYFYYRSFSYDENNCFVFDDNCAIDDKSYVIGYIYCRTDNSWKFFQPDVVSQVEKQDTFETIAKRKAEDVNVRYNVPSLIDNRLLVSKITLLFQSKTTYAQYKYNINMRDNNVSFSLHLPQDAYNVQVYFEENYRNMTDCYELNCTDMVVNNGTGGNKVDILIRYTPRQITIDNDETVETTTKADLYTHSGDNKATQENQEEDTSAADLDNIQTQETTIYSAEGTTSEDIFETEEGATIITRDDPANIYAEETEVTEQNKIGKDTTTIIIIAVIAVAAIMFIFSVIKINKRKE